MPPAGRPDLHIVARFLDRLAEPGPWTRSTLQRGVRLNYDLFRKYLDLLVERGWVKASRAKGSGAKEKETFGLTPAGHKLRSDLVAWLEGLFGGRL